MNAPVRISSHAAIDAFVRSALPAAAVAVADPRQTHGPLLPEEAPAIERAVERRRREFAAGRAAARRAMAELGGSDCALPQGPDRVPVWPSGFTGSISHCDTCCIATVARTSSVAALGVDVEPDAPLPAGLLDTVCSAAERARIARLPEPERGLWARMVFSAKECAFKAQFPLSRTLFGFDALELDWTTCGAFSATFHMAVPRFTAGATISGRFARVGGFVVTAAALPAGGSR